MIERSLVYIRAANQADGPLVGCGVMIEGGYIATCRHVWHMATTGSEDSKPEDLRVEIEFPFSHNGTATTRTLAARADECLAQSGPHPDLVLLTAEDVPSGNVVEPVELAREARLETGAAFSVAGVPGLDADNPQHVRDIRVEGQLADHIGSDGRRQFTGGNQSGYWTDRGSSGSPVFLTHGQQLAGIVSLSQTRVNVGGSHLHGGFVVPATIIRSHLERIVAARVAEQQQLDPRKLKPVLDALRTEGVSLSEVPDRLLKYIADARRQGEQPPEQPKEAGDGDVTGAIADARAKAAALDVTAARAVLQSKIEQEQATRTRRLVPLLRERATMEGLAFDHSAAKATLQEIADLDPDDVWAWINLGELIRTTAVTDEGGALHEAEAVFRQAEAAARRNNDDRNVAVALERIGNVLLAEGKREGALSAFRAAMAIQEALSRGDPDNADRQRDLSVSHNRIGDVLLVEGNREAALGAYQAAMAIRETLARSDRDNTQWQRDVAVSHDNVGDVLLAEGKREAALAAYQAAMAISESLSRRDPDNTQWQRDVAVSHKKIGNVLLAEGNRNAALTAFRAATAIDERLTGLDPGNTLWQRDLGLSHERIGDVLLAEGNRDEALTAYKAAMAIRESLSGRDPGNTLWQRDLSLSHETMGDIMLAEGNREAAVNAHRAAMAIRETLSRRDPGNTGWQRDLGVSYDRIGNTHRDAGDHAAALAVYQQSLAIDERLIQLDPGNAQWKRDLEISRAKVAKATEALAKSKPNPPAPPKKRGRQKSKS